MKITLKRKEVKIHPRLLSILAELEAKALKMGGTVVSTDADRTVLEHIAEYKSLEFRNLLGGKKWIDAIPWESKHLPCWDGFLHALDLTIQVNGKPTVSGKDMAQMINDICKAKGFKRGLGVGKMFVHVDIREEDGNWTYPY